MPPYEPFRQSFPEWEVMFRMENEGEREIHLGFLDYREGLREYPDVLSESLPRGVDPETVDWPAYQIGGVPCLWQMPEPNTCPKSNGQMMVLATIDNRNGTKEGWCGGEGVVMVYLLCRPCQVIRASHQVD